MLIRCNYKFSLSRQTVLSLGRQTVLSLRLQTALSLSRQAGLFCIHFGTDEISLRTLCIFQGRREYLRSFLRRNPRQATQAKSKMQRSCLLNR